MFTQACLGLVLLVSIPAWAQVSTSDGGIGLAMTDQMAVPPPVSGDASPTGGGSEAHRNFLRLGVVVTAEHTDNVLGYTSNPISDVDYSIYPTIAIDRAVPRLHLSLNYSPGFTFYEHTSARNQTDQALSFNLLYRLSPHVTATVRDYLRQTSSVLNANPLSSGSDSGVPQTPISPVIAPVGDQIGNAAGGELNYQFSRNGMIGASGTFTYLHFLDPSQVPGLYDSNSKGGSGFYSHRLSKHHYIGATYQYALTLAYPTGAVTQVQTSTVFGFYTLYLKPTFSISVSGGPQHYEISQAPLPAQGSWSPTFSASSAWQGRHTSYSAIYSRVIFGGGGLVGVFKADLATAIARWQVSRVWSLGATGSYGNNKDVTPSTYLSTEGGHSIFGTVSVDRQLGEHFKVEGGYTHLHESYGFSQGTTNSPNTNREFISISYHFARPLGG
jgi:hypothetical protein